MEPSELAPPPAPNPLGSARSQTLALSFCCNNRCRMCLVEQMRGVVPAMGFERFKEHVDENRRTRQFDRLILSGAEVTLADDLPRYVRYARESGAYAHLRVQTNGRRFSDRRFAEECLAAGLDEYYVSVQAHTDKLEQRITRSRSSFAQMAAGLANLRELGATLITSTVICSLNLEALEEIVEFVLGFGPARVELREFVPTVRAQESLLVRVGAAAKPLNACLDRLDGAGVSSEVVWFPACLLGARAALGTLPLPTTTIDERFWQRFPDFSCFFGAACALHPRCGGLSHPYVHRFGWEVDLLRPPIDAPRPSAPSGAWNGRAEEWLALFDGPDGAPVRDAGPWRLTGTSLAPGQARFHFVTREGLQLDLRLEPKDDSRPRQAQTASFNLSAAPGGGEPASSQLLTRFGVLMFALVSRNDDGRLSLGAAP